MLYVPQWAQLIICEDGEAVIQTTNYFEVFVIETGVTSWPHVSISGHLVALLENPHLFRTHPLLARQVIHGQLVESLLSNYHYGCEFRLLCCRFGLHVLVSVEAPDSFL